MFHDEFLGIWTRSVVFHLSTWNIRNPILLPCFPHSYCMSVCKTLPSSSLIPASVAIFTIDALSNYWLLIFLDTVWLWFHLWEKWSTGVDAAEHNHAWKWDQSKSQVTQSEVVFLGNSCVEVKMRRWLEWKQLMDFTVCGTLEWLCCHLSAVSHKSWSPINLPWISMCKNLIYIHFQSHDRSVTDLLITPMHLKCSTYCEVK